MNLQRRLAAEGVGTAFLLAAVVGSGIMGERLAGGNVAIALLANTIATGATLVALILTLGPIEENGKKYSQMFMEVRVNFIGKMEEDLYTITSAYHQENGSSHMLTFDLPKSAYELFLAEVPELQRAQIAQALSRQPFKITLGDEGPVVTIVGEIGDKVFTNENESYRPFIAEEFVKDVAPW